MRIKVAVIAIAILVLCAEVEAGKFSPHLAVTAIVKNSCTADTDVDLAASGASTVGEVKVDCSAQTPYAVTLNTGIVEGASVTHAGRTRGVDTLPYDLFKDGTYKVKWGSGAGPETVSGTYGAAQPSAAVFGHMKDAHAMPTTPDRLTMTVEY